MQQAKPLKSHGLAERCKTPEIRNIAEDTQRFDIFECFVLFAHVLCSAPMTEKETTMPRTRTEPTIPSDHEALAAREAIRILDAQADGEALDRKSGV